MLKIPSPSPSRRFAGRIAVALLAAGAAVVAWAAQPAAAPAGAPMVEVALSISIDGGPPSTPTLRHPAGEAFAVSGGEGAGAWSAEMTVNVQADGTFFLASTLRRGGELVGEPRLLFDGRGATIDVGSDAPGGQRFRMDVKAKVLPPAVSGSPRLTPPPAQAGAVVPARDAFNPRASALSSPLRAAHATAAAWRADPALDRAEPKPDDC